MSDVISYRGLTKDISGVSIYLTCSSLYVLSIGYKKSKIEVDVFLKFRLESRKNGIFWPLFDFFRFWRPIINQKFNLVKNQLCLVNRH